MVADARHLDILRVLFRAGLCGLLAATFLAPAAALSAEVPSESATEPQEAGEFERAPVMLDGEVLFYVRGVTAYPARERAKVISGKIRALAADRSVSVDSLRVLDTADRTHVAAPGYLITAIVEADAEAEGVPRQLLAEVMRERTVRAIKAYREDRAPGALVTRAAYALGATLVALILVVVTIHLFRRTKRMLERRLTSRIESLRAKSGDAIRTEPLLAVAWGLIATARALLIITILYFYLNFTLALFPWTRAFSKQILGIVLDPLRSMGAAFVSSLPGLVFIALIVIVTRYLLSVVRLVFAGVDQKRIAWPGFESEWAWPTYRLVRLLIVAFALVFAYPHIPGSSSGAFKGVSLLLGVVFSLGSSSIVANVIAGYTMIYRRAFRVGDRIKVNEIEGVVTEAGVLVTHVRTIKNEDIVVPNSVILNTDVKNFSTLARTRGLILHTTVGIGYETPWRQVEAMLKLAAERTTGLLKDPPPFVLQKALGDFAVTYELNAYTDDPLTAVQRYAELHRNILDAFNEYGVQIMTPAYEGDPAEPKTVPREQWFSPPAPEPASGGEKASSPGSS